MLIKALKKMLPDLTSAQQVIRPTGNDYGASYQIQTLFNVSRLSLVCYVYDPTSNPGSFNVPWVQNNFMK
jgi:hypothetical protein